MASVEHLLLIVLLFIIPLNSSVEVFFDSASGVFYWALFDVRRYYKILFGQTIVLNKNEIQTMRI